MPPAIPNDDFGILITLNIGLTMIGILRRHNHWDGRTVLVERPAVAMDNTTAERVVRTPVVGRKHSEGSGSVWSAHLAAMMVRVRQTGRRWDRHPHQWLTAFFHAWADHGGTSPTDRSAFLPWQRTPERSARSACANAVATLCQSLQREGRTGWGRHLLRSDRTCRFLHRQTAQELYPDAPQRRDGELRLSDRRRTCLTRCRSMWSHHSRRDDDVVCSCSLPEMG